MTQDTPQRDCPGSAKAPGEILELFKGGYLSIAETIDALEPAFLGAAQGATDCGGLVVTGEMQDAFDKALPRREDARHPNDRDKPLYNALADGDVFAEAFKAAYALLAPQPIDPAYPSWQPIETAPRDGTWLLVWETGINTKYHPSEIARFVNGRWENSAMKYVNAVAWQSAPVGPLVPSPQTATTTRNLVDSLCDDCPPVGYETDKTRCLVCPRAALSPTTQAAEVVARAERGSEA